MSFAIEMEDLQSNPEKYGFCSFEEFRKNKDKWKLLPEHLFRSVEEAGEQFKPFIRRLKYQIEGYSCDTLEKVQDVARQMGFQEMDLEIWPEMIDVGAGKCDVLVRFFHKQTFNKRAGW